MDNTSSPVAPAPTPAPKKSSGAIIAIIVIIILVVIGGLYFWGRQLMTSAPAQNSTIPAVSSSDDVQSIANDAAVNVDATASVDVGDLEATLK